MLAAMPATWLLSADPLLMAESVNEPVVPTLDAHECLCRCMCSSSSALNSSAARLTRLVDVTVAAVGGSAGTSGSSLD